MPFGKPTTPLTIWSACLGSTPRFIAISIVSSNFETAFAFTKDTASEIDKDALPSNEARAAVVLFPNLAITSPQFP